MPKIVSKSIVAQGAEAVILRKGNSIIKDRIPKSYRIKELDEKIRKHRTKTEKKLLEKASKIINAPNPLPLKELTSIEMPFIKGEKLSESLNSFPLEKQKKICRIMGEEIGKLHNADIIHGDLTTSNMIFVNKNKIGDKINGQYLVNNENLRGEVKQQAQKRGDSNSQIFFIDFGLGYISIKPEDKAVDLHLLKQALEAKHFKNWEALFNEVKKGYKTYKGSKKVLERFEAVEKRGRYKEH